MHYTFSTLSKLLSCVYIHSTLCTSFQACRIGGSLARIFLAAVTQPPLSKQSPKISFIYLFAVQFLDWLDLFCVQIMRSYFIIFRRFKFLDMYQLRWKLSSALLILSMIMIFLYHRIEKCNAIKLSFQAYYFPDFDRTFNIAWRSKWLTI